MTPGSRLALELIAFLPFCIPVAGENRVRDSLRALRVFAVNSGSVSPRRRQVRKGLDGIDGNSVEVLDEDDLVVRFVVHQLVYHLAHEKDAEAAGPQALLFAHVHVLIWLVFRVADGGVVQ